MVGRTLHGDPARYPDGLVTVGDGVLAWMQPNGSWGETNAGAVLGSKTMLLVDTLWDLRQARRMLDALGTERALTTAVNTHADGDHWWGNAELPAATTIITTERALAEMTSDAPPAAMATMARLARRGSWLPGPLGALPGYVGSMLGPFDFGAVGTRLPETTFTGSTELSVDGRTVRLIDLGPAHTASDVVAHVADAGVVFAGDLLFIGVTPISWHGPLTGWIRALDTMLAMDADTFVPGHGRVCGPAQVRELRDYLSWLVEAGGRAAAAGKPPITAARELLRSPGFVPFRHWLDAERIAINLETVRRDYLGIGPGARDARHRAKLLRRCAALR